jgi:NADPH2:quinone reductase
LGVAKNTTSQSTKASISGTVKTTLHNPSKFGYKASTLCPASEREVTTATSTSECNSNMRNNSTPVYPVPPTIPTRIIFFILLKLKINYLNTYNTRYFILIKSMLAIEITKGELHPTERPIPKISETEVLIKVHAAGINRPDVMQRKGLYPPPPGASDIPGLEVSGKIIKLGKKVTHLNVGDHVCALVTGGGYAEYSLANAELCLPIPNGFNFIQAAALPETFFTVWSNVFDRAKIKPHENLLIHGGSSGIGTTAIQLVKAFGANVFITAGTKEKCDFCSKLGADVAINYKLQDFVTEIIHLTHDKGVDVILDMVGGDYFPRNLKCMGFDARLVQIAIQNGPKTEVNLLPIMLKRLTITGSTLRARNNAFKIDIAKQLLDKVWPLLESGDIKPVIHTIFPLEEAGKAHQLMESSEHMGKIILTL